MRFRIVGEGKFGTALSRIFNKNCLLENSLGMSIQSFSNEDVLIPAVPSHAVVEVLKKYVKPDGAQPCCVMLVSKGLASANLLSVDVEFLGLPILFASGPNFASEICQDQSFLSMTIAGPNRFTTRIADFLDNVIVDKTACLIFPQVMSIMKNITAFVIGYMNFLENARATIIMQGIKDGVNLAKFLGSCDTDLCKACVGDFFLTCTSMQSRNYTAGVYYRENKKLCSEATLEGLASIKKMVELKSSLEMPIVDFALKIIDDLKPDPEELKALL